MSSERDRDIRKADPQAAKPSSDDHGEAEECTQAPQQEPQQEGTQQQEGHRQEQLQPQQRRRSGLTLLAPLVIPEIADSRRPADEQGGGAGPSIRFAAGGSRPPWQKVKATRTAAAERDDIVQLDALEAGPAAGAAEAAGTAAAATTTEAPAAATMEVSGQREAAQQQREGRAMAEDPQLLIKLHGQISAVPIRAYCANWQVDGRTVADLLEQLQQHRAVCGETAALVLQTMQQLLLPTLQMVSRMLAVVPVGALMLPGGVLAREAVSIAAAADAAAATEALSSLLSNLSAEMDLDGPDGPAMPSLPVRGGWRTPSALGAGPGPSMEVEGPLNKNLAGMVGACEVEAATRLLQQRQPEGSAAAEAAHIWTAGAGSSSPLDLLGAMGAPQSTAEATVLLLVGSLPHLRHPLSCRMPAVHSFHKERLAEAYAQCWQCLCSWVGKDGSYLHPPSAGEVSNCFEVGKTILLATRALQLLVGALVAQRFQDRANLLAQVLSQEQRQQQASSSSSSLSAAAEAAGSTACGGTEEGAARGSSGGRSSGGTIGAAPTGLTSSSSAAALPPIAAAPAQGAEIPAAAQQQQYPGGTAGLLRWVTACALLLQDVQVLLLRLEEVVTEVVLHLPGAIMKPRRARLVQWRDAPALSLTVQTQVSHLSADLSGVPRLTPIQQEVRKLNEHALRELRLQLQGEQQKQDLLEQQLAADLGQHSPVNTRMMVFFPELYVLFLTFLEMTRQKLNASCPRTNREAHKEHQKKLSMLFHSQQRALPGAGSSSNPNGNEGDGAQEQQQQQAAGSHAFEAAVAEHFWCVAARFAIAGRDLCPSWGGQGISCCFNPVLKPGLVLFGVMTSGSKKALEAVAVKVAAELPEGRREGGATILDRFYWSVGKKFQVLVGSPATLPAFLQTSPLEINKPTMVALYVEPLPAKQQTGAPAERTNPHLHELAFARALCNMLAVVVYWQFFMPDEQGRSQACWDERLMALGGHNMTVVLPHERVVDSSTVAELLASPEMMLRIAEVPTSMVTD